MADIEEYREKIRLEEERMEADRERMREYYRGKIVEYINQIQDVEALDVIWKFAMRLLD